MLQFVDRAYAIKIIYDRRPMPSLMAMKKADFMCHSWINILQTIEPGLEFFTYKANLYIMMMKFTNMQ